MTRRLSILMLLPLFALAACGEGGEPAPPARLTPAAPAAESLGARAALGDNPSVYQCEDGRSLRAAYPDSDTAVLEVDGQTHVLKAARSASGARYVGAAWQWWTRGLAEGMIAPLAAGEEIADAPSVACRVVEAPLAEGPIAPQSAQGAAQVVQTYFALLEAGRHDEAWALWAQGGEASGMDRAAFAASFDRYASYHAEVGAPGPVEGAAGSLYVEVPVHAYGELKSGEIFHLRGPIRLRRVNNVPGATAEQLSWRIAASGLTPRPEAP